jgi:hypothetical protein
MDRGIGNYRGGIGEREVARVREGEGNREGFKTSEEGLGSW